MKQVLSLLLIFVMFFSAVFATEVGDTSSTPKTKVAFIYSENIEAFHRNGVDYQLKEGLEDFTYEQPTLIKTYFLNTNYETVDENRFNSITEKVTESIKKFDPDYIVTFGSRAFQLFIKHFGDTEAHVANLCISELNEELVTKAFETGNFITIHRPGIDKFLKYIHDNGVATPHFYIIRDVSPQSYRIYDELRELLLERSHFFKIKNIEVTNYQELKKAIFELYKHERGVIIPLFKALPDYDTNLVLNWETLIAYVVRTNKKHIELILNDDGSSLGSAISLSSNHRICQRPNAKPINYLKLFFGGTGKETIILEDPDLIINKERLLDIGSPELLEDLGEVDCLKDDNESIR
jgi:hypothetical protein